MKLLANDITPGNLIEVADDEGTPVRVHVLATAVIGGTVEVDGIYRADGATPSPWGDDDESRPVVLALDSIETVYLRG